jgi:hypothetical protein
MLVALLVPAAGPPAAAAVEDCDGVWVVVDARQLGGSVTTRCSPGDPSDGVQALEGAGHRVDYVPGQPGFICQLDQRPNPCPGVPPEDAYWSYWHADPGAGWVYSNRGALVRDPARGTAEGWRFGDGSQPPPPPPAPVSNGGSGGSGSGGDPDGEGSGGGSNGGSSNGGGSNGDGSNGGSNGGGSNGGSSDGSSSNESSNGGSSGGGSSSDGSSSGGGASGDGSGDDDGSGGSSDAEGSERNGGSGGSTSDDPSEGAPREDPASGDVDTAESGDAPGDDDGAPEGRRSAADRGARDASIREDGELVPDPDGTETLEGQAAGSADDEDQAVTLADTPRGGGGSWASLGIGATLALGLAAGAVVQVRRRRALGDVT